jgi:hypothetical protein
VFTRRAEGRTRGITSRPPPKWSEPLALAADALTRFGNGGKEAIDDRPRNESNPFVLDC